MPTLASAMPMLDGGAEPQPVGRDARAHDALADALRHGAGAGQAGFGQKHREFLAADTADDVGFALAADAGLGDRLDGRVADRSGQWLSLIDLK